MELLLGCIILFVIASAVMVWINRGRMDYFEAELYDLQAEIKKIKSQLPNIITGYTDKKIDVTRDSLSAPAEIKPLAVKPSVKVAAKEVNDFAESYVKFNEPKKKPEIEKKEEFSFEKQFGARLPVWIGGIALALAGFFMVKYSIETGLLTEKVRVVLGSVFGVALLYAGNLVYNKKDFANGTRISQALSGAGIADLYVCIFSATNLYHLIPPLAGFAGMAVITILAVILSLRHGAPIAALGMIGGFLTPALIRTNEPNIPLLFIYLFFVFSGLFAVIRKEKWWLLGLVSVGLAFLWVLTLLFGGYFRPDYALWFGLFLLGITAVTAISSNDYDSKSLKSDEMNKLSLMNYITMGVATVMMGAVAVKSNFGALEWGMFGLISAGGIILAYFRSNLYGFAPWLSLGVSVVMLLFWQTGEKDVLAITIISFAVLYSFSGYFFMWRSEKPALWAGIAGSASIVYYLIAYYKLDYSLRNFTNENPESLVNGMHLWGLIAIMLSVVSVNIVREISSRFSGDEKSRQKLLAIFAVTTTAFLSLAFTIELDREFLSVAFAAQLLAISWVNTRVDITALRKIAAVVACIFGLLLVPQIILLIQITVYSLVEAKLYAHSSVPIIDWPLFQLGVPAIMFVGSSILLRKQRDSKLVRIFEVSAIALVAVMGYYLTRHAFHIDENVLFVKAGFAERGVITNILFLYGLACFWIGRKYNRSAVSVSAMAISMIALFRITYFDLLFSNPLWSHVGVGEMPILNSLILPYGISIAWIYFVNQELEFMGRKSFTRFIKPFMLVLAFTFVSMNVRQVYHGEYLDSGVTSNAEIYSYSAAWLVMGVILLFAGTLKNNSMVRIASLCVMILTVGKVFLYDASELTGLYRVFSFLGLGLSLLALSYFYTRFVFSDKNTARN